MKKKKWMDDGKGNELKRTRMEKVLDRKEIIGNGNQLFLGEYFQFRRNTATT